MEVKTEDVRFEGDGRPIDAYVAAPASGRPHPALIVVSEIWGLVEHIRDVSRRFARQGYLALAPDLYTGELRDAMSPTNIMAGMLFLRNAPPEVQRDPSTLGERVKGLSPDKQTAIATLVRVMSPEQRERFAWDLVGALDYLRSRPDVRAERVGSLGFCMGGGLTARLATLSPSLRAIVIFYGENPPLDAVGEIRCPVLGLYGGDDRRITDLVPDLVRAMEREGKEFDYHVYPGAKHAFFNDTGPNYQAEVAGDSWHRVLAFLGKELKEEEPRPRPL